MCIWLFFVIFRISDGTVFTSLDGFRLFLGQPSEFPLLRSNHILLRPGLGHSVQVSASHVSTDTSSDPPGIISKHIKACRQCHAGTGKWPLSMVSLPPEKRGCKFPDETDGLDFHKRYSRTSCRFECSLKKATEQVQCIPWYLPQKTGVMTCRFEREHKTLTLFVFTAPPRRQISQGR